MPIRNDREYRISDKIEIREENEKVIVRGYASTFDPYTLFEDPDGYTWREQIMPDAFNEADLSDVVFLRDHSGQVYARTSNGLLVLRVDGHGLLAETDLTQTEAAREMMKDIQIGNYTQMSFSFIVAEDRYEEKDRVVTRYIEKIKKVYDVSAVAFPANPGTDIGLSYRGLFDGAIKEIQTERSERKRAIEKLRLKIKLIGG